MRMVVPPLLLQLVKLCVIAFAFTTVQGSTGHDIPASPETFSVFPPIEETPGPIPHRKSLGSNAPSSASQLNGTNLLPPPAIPPVTSTTTTHTIEGIAPSLSPSTPPPSPPFNMAPPPSVIPSTPPVSPPFDMAPPPTVTPSTPLLSPPFNMAPPPSVTPSTPLVSPPFDMDPPPSATQSTPLLSPPFDLAPPRSVTPSSPLLSPPFDMAPPPFVTPSTPLVSPPFDMAPPPSVTPITPVVSPASHTDPPPSVTPSTPVVLPPSHTAPPPSVTPSTPVVLPPSHPAPPPSVTSSTPVVLPSSHPAPPPSVTSSTPVVLPPSHPSPPPSVTPSTPVESPPFNPAPPPSVTATPPVVSPSSNPAPPPSVTPSAPVVSPSSNTAPPPSVTPSVPLVSPPPNTAPPPSGTPRAPLVSPPPNTAPPPSLTPITPVVSPPSNTDPPPSVTPITPVVSPPSNTDPPPSVTPSSPAVFPPSNTASPPSVTVTPRTPVVSPTSNTPSPSSVSQGPVPSVLPSAPPGEAPVSKSHVPVPGAPGATPSRNSPQNSPSNHSSIPGALPPFAHERNASNNKPPITEPIAPVQKSPVVHSISPQIAPSRLPVPVSSPTGELPKNSSVIHPVRPGESPSVLPDLGLPPASTPPSSINRTEDGRPVAEPPHGIPKPVSPMSHSPATAPSTHTSMRHSNDAPVPPLSSPRSPLNKWYHSPASSPSISFPKPHHARIKVTSPAPASLYFISPTASKQQGPIVAPPFIPTSRRRRDAPPPFNLGSHVSPAPSPTSMGASRQIEMPVFSPKTSPSIKSPKMPVLPPIRALPPPPPNEDCSTTICTEPLTNTPPGSPCSCVRPMQVGLRLSVALYTFFPLVLELSTEIASGVFMKQSQVRIMGANAASQEPEKTVVLIDLVPLGEKFDNTTAFLTYYRFWHNQVFINPSFFGDYEVLYVHYPGLPPSPPSAPSSITIIDDGSGNGSNARTIKPEGVNVPKRRQKKGLSGGLIAIAVLSAFVAVVLCSAIAWILLFKCRGRISQPAPALQPSHAKPSGAAGSITGSGLDSASLSFGSSIATYTGSAKTYSASEIKRATGNFDDSRILGEGGFGVVYSGVLEDGTSVAVKVLKRDDQQGGREFLAEVEMLSRLHHRNLVKLIGICVEDARCLVYELIPNGSVESHLHGPDKESAPLSWDARLKIALGAARGLAYLHEDSSPRVIHRDFKSSNILLEHDFTPKVSDFGLARTAMDEENRHISTRVMGTFGYVAPEYAMTGHLLVKSDVYSYGVVLLELLTGRKPVDMSQLPGQENLVAWARPLLTTREGLEAMIDPSLGSDLSFDSVAKVAAIASMCVQPEVQHRPFMGEVVQALKLVSSECDEAKEVGSRSSTDDDVSIDLDARASNASGQFPDPLQRQQSVPNYSLGFDTERGLPVSDLFSSSARFGNEESSSFRRYSSSGPLRIGRGRQMWQKVRRLSADSVNEHGAVFRLWPGSH